MKIVALTHANLPGTPVYADIDLIAMWYHSSAGGCTHVMTIGGALMPVKESPEQVSQMKKTGNEQQPKGETNGTN
jgi:hypothetical protein